MILLAVGLSVVLVAVVGVLAANLIGSDDGTGPAADRPAAKEPTSPSPSPTAGSGKPNTLRHDRPGYDRAKLDTRIGDPFALQLKPGDRPLDVRDENLAIPPCALFRVADIRELGYELYPQNYGPSIQRSYLDPKGKARFAPAQWGLPYSDGTPSCYYGLLEKDGSKAFGTSISVSIWTPWIVEPEVLSDNMESLDYRPDPTTGEFEGFQLYTRDNDEDPLAYRLHSEDLTIGVTVDVLDDQADGPRVLHGVWKNLQRLRENPEGVAVPDYDTPTFTKSWVRACDLMDNETVRLITDRDASPLLGEHLTTATGVADFASVSDYKKKTNYIRNRCIMRAPDPEYNQLGRASDDELYVTTFSYENEQAASLGLRYLSVGEGNEKASKGTGLGDEAYLYLDRDGQMVLAFRDGRFVVELLYNFAGQTGTGEEYTRLLNPAADHIAAKLAALQ